MRISTSTDSHLRQAAWEGDIDACKSWIASGADINGRGYEGNTSVGCAAQNGHSDVVKMLVDLGADIHLRTESGKTPLQLAAAAGHIQSCGILIGFGADTSGFANHCTNSDAHKAIAAIIDLDSKLRQATRSGNAELCDRLIASGAHVNARDSDGNTALILVAKPLAQSIFSAKPWPQPDADLQAWRRSVAALLIGHGADLDARNVLRYSALRLVAMANDRKMAALLIRAGADTDGILSFCKTDESKGAFTALINEEAMARRLARTTRPADREATVPQDPDGARRPARTRMGV